MATGHDDGRGPGATAADATPAAPDAIEVRGWRVPAILVPWGIQAVVAFDGGRSTPWRVGFTLLMIGAAPIAAAVWSLRRERRARGLPVNGLEGFGWTYLVITAFGAVLSLPAWFWPDEPLS